MTIKKIVILILAAFIPSMIVSSLFSFNAPFLYLTDKSGQVIYHPLVFIPACVCLGLVWNKLSEISAVIRGVPTVALAGILIGFIAPGLGYNYYMFWVIAVMAFMLTIILTKDEKPKVTEATETSLPSPNN